MKAKPGTSIQPLKPLTVSLFKPPAPPKDLTAEQRRAWNEIITNPALEDVDVSLLFDYVDTMKLRDLAWTELEGYGIMIQTSRGPKTNPSYKVWRDCQDHLIKLRELMLLTPKARFAMKSVGLLPSGITDEDEIDTDD